MAKIDNNTSESKDATSQPALHSRFSWFAPSVCEDGDAEYLTRVYDICEGAKVIFEVVQRDAIENGRHARPLFDPQATERLVLFATAALGMLGTATFERIEAINNAAEAAAVQTRAK